MNEPSSASSGFRQLTRAVRSLEGRIRTYRRVADPASYLSAIHELDHLRMRIRDAHRRGDDPAPLLDRARRYDHALGEAIEQWSSGAAASAGGAVRATD